MAFQASVPAWEASGVKVIPVHSEPSGTYVQDVFAADMGLGDGAGVGVLCCGHKEMVNAVKGLVSAQGVSEDKVLLNF